MVWSTGAIGWLQTLSDIRHVQVLLCRQGCVYEVLLLKQVLCSEKRYFFLAASRKSVGRKILSLVVDCMLPCREAG